MNYLSKENIVFNIKDLKFGLCLAGNIEITKKSQLADQEFLLLESFIKNKFSSIPPSADPVVSRVRKMYRRIGWEPTRYRPSSEAMIRRFLKDTGLYRINNFVDLGNIASTRFHLPMGLYDLAKIKGKIVCDVGTDDESYQGISKQKISAGGKLILRDDQGIFGNPTADSVRTALTNKTQSVLALFFCPPEVSDAYLTDTVNFLLDLYKSECLHGTFSTALITP